MRLARCLPLLVAAVTSALPTSSSPERSQDPAVSSDKNNNADLIGASVMTTGSVSAALYSKDAHQSLKGSRSLVNIVDCYYSEKPGGRV